MKAESVQGLIEGFKGDTFNAMHSILGFLELLSEGSMDPKQREYVETCRAVATRHCRDIEDVSLVLGPIPEQTQIIGSFAPGVLFTQVCELVGVSAARKSARLFCEVAGDVPRFVSGDGDRIGVTLLRLIEDVLTGIDGDLHLSLGVQASPNGCELMFKILAPGGMLPEPWMCALQQEGFEFDSSSSNNGVLRLAATRRLITGLAGAVNVANDPFTGTLIKLIIPVGPALEEGTSSPAIKGDRPGSDQALQILIAEDSDDSFHLFKAYLQDEPHLVTRARNGAEAVEIAMRESFDLLFMDIRMPIMDGYSATRRIRELETGKDRPRLPIIVLSAEELHVQRRRGAPAGCSAHLSKPLRKQELLAAIRIYSTGSTETVGPVSLVSH